MSKNSYMIINKACPVVIRSHQGLTEILAFRHPLAGNQIVKGTIEINESLEVACDRELHEEAGIVAKSKDFLGVWDAKYKKQVWGFYLMESNSVLPEAWSHDTRDGGGLTFDFFWQTLNEKLNDDYHHLFKGAIRFIYEALDQRL